MKKTKSVWWQPQGWLSSGSVIVIILLICYLVFIIVRFVMPRLRSIGKVYNSAGISRDWDVRRG